MSDPGKVPDFTADIISLNAKRAAAPPVPQVQAPAPAASAVPDFTDDINLLAQSRAHTAVGTVIGAQDANPDHAGRANHLAGQLGVPAGVIEGDLPAFEKQHQIQQAAAAVHGNPNLASWLAADQQRARVAKDDFDQLGTVSKAWTAFSSGAAQGKLQNQKGVLGSEKQAGADVQPQINAIDQQLKGGPELQGVYGALQKVGGFAGGMLDVFMRSSLAGGTAGGIAGAAAGSAAGGIGAIPGAAAGAVLGAAVVGPAVEMGKIAAGNTYLDLSQMKGHDGQPMSEPVKNAAALVVGLGTAALGTVGIKNVGGAAGEASAKLLQDAVVQATTRPTVARALTNFATSLGKAGLTGAALNTAMEGTSIFGEEFAKQLAGGTNFDTVFNDPIQRQQTVDRLITAATDGALLFPLAHLPFAAGSLVGDTLRARSAATDVANFQQLETGAVDSKTRGRSLDAFQSFMQQHADGSPVENLGVSGEAVRTLYQSAGLEPGPDDGLLGHVVPDLAEQMKQASETGGDIIVPTAAYVAHLAGTDISTALKADIRFRPDGMTMREADAYHAARGEHLADLATAGQASMDAEMVASDPGRAVHADVFSKLRAAGVTNDAAQQYASLVASRYEARAERLGGGKDALALYREQGLDVQRQVPDSLRHVPTDEQDLVINALRNTDRKAPSDKTLFGPSLHEAVKAAGGIVDTGGELRAMDLHLANTKGLIRKAGADTADNINHSMDTMALRMWEHGYFPDKMDRPSEQDLIDAMRGGDTKYAEGAGHERKAAFEEAVRDLDHFLSEKGIDPAKASNQEIKAAIEKHIAEQDAEGGSRILAQGERGRISIDQGRSVITLFKDADLSTFLHETGHLWLEEMLADARLPDAPDALKADVAKILDHLGMKSIDDVPTTEQHETFARSIETYLMEGRAPSAALAGAFRRFKSWLIRIYKSVASLNAPINDELRGVFDRMVASDTAIQSWRQAEGLLPMDKTALGLTDAEYAAYTKGVDKARNAADEKLVRKTMDAVRKQRTDEWKAEADGVRTEVSEQVRARPDLQAQYFLRTGKQLNDPEAPAVDRIKLSKSDLVDNYGSDEVTKALPSGIVSAEGGAHPDEVAELFGYRSGDEMVRALMSLEASKRQAEEATGKDLDGQKYVRHLIDAETRERMLDRHGDALNDGSIEDEALAAVHNTAQADVMATEMRAIAKRAGKMPLTLEDITRWADEQISGMKLDRGTDNKAFARLEAKYGKEVERALLKGDVAAAFEAKQRQLINHVMARKAAEAAEDEAKGRKLFTRYASKAVMPSMEQGYLDRIHEILKRIGYETKRSDDELKVGLDGASLTDFVRNKAEEGNDLAVSDFLLDPAWKKDSVDAMTVDEMRGVSETVQSLAHVARWQQSVMDEGKRVEMIGLVDEAVEKMAELKQREVPAEINPGTGAGIQGALQRMWTLGRKVDAALLKQEQVFDWLDRDNPNGVFNRVVFRRLKDAQHKENDMLRDVTGKVRDLGKEMPKGWTKGLDERKAVDELPDRRTGKPYIFRKKDLLALALNMGNDGNLEKLSRGYGWDKDAIKSVLDRELQKHDWDFVQGIWDTFEGLYPEIEAMTRRVTGVGPEKVVAREVETPHGTYRGGYYPVVYDPLKSHAAELRGQKAGAAMFENNYFRATTPKGHTMARVEGYHAPIRLSLDVIPWKLGQAVHDLSFREAVMDADKFLTQRRIREGVDATLGHEYTQQFRKWLQSIANDRNIDDKGLAGMDWLARQARINTTVVGIGFRVSTMLKHGMTALSNSVGEVGGKAMLRGAAEVYGSPSQYKAKWDYAMSRSGELRHRMNSIDRDVREGLRTLQGQTGVIAAAERYSHYGVAMLDMGSAVPTWYGAYRKALDAGSSDPDAVYAADKAVRNAHGAQGVTDIAQVQRGGEVAKLFTMFYGFFNHIYNRQRDTVRIGGEGVDKVKTGDYAGARRDFAMVLARSIYYVMIPAFTEALVAGDGPGEDESWGAWAAKAILGEIPAGIPLVRDIAKAAISGRDYAMSPVARAVTTAISSGKDFGAAVGLRDKEPSDKWVSHAINTAGYVFGLPTGQAAGSVQYLWDVLDGDTQPEGTSDFIRGVIFGPKPKGH